jgi:transmembrane sensor
VLALDAGAVFVASAADGRSAPVEVLTPFGSVQELGTRFVVRLAGAEPALVVKVREGAVAAASGGRRYVTRPGQELIVHRGGRAEQRPDAGWGPDWAWVMEAAPRFVSEGRTVGDLLAWVAEETGWRVELADRAALEAQGHLLYGDIGELRADRAAFALLPGASLEAERRGGTLVVRAAR